MTPPRKRAKPRDIKSGEFSIAWVDGTHGCITAPRLWDPKEARRLAAWLNRFADWAEGKRK